MKLSTGRDMRAIDDIIGLSNTLDVGTGYDSMATMQCEWDPDGLTPAECVEVADRMIARWQAFKAVHATANPHPED